MTTEVTTTNGTLAPSLPWTREQIDLIKSTVARGATDNELALFLYVCKQTGLDPLARQIHAVKRWNRAENREMMSIQTGIDGYRLIAARTGQHMGTEAATFDTEEAEHPNRATVTVYRNVQGEKVAFTATARWAEYVQTTKEGSANSFWHRMPYLMLEKCAEALALRKAFPAELSSLYTHDEMAQADNEPDQHHGDRPLRTVGKPAIRMAAPEEEEEQRAAVAAHVPIPPSAPTQRTDTRLISEAQQKRLFPLLREAGVSVDALKAFLIEVYDLEHTKDIPRAQYDQLCQDITGGGITAWLASKGVHESAATPTESEVAAL